MIGPRVPADEDGLSAPWQRLERHIVLSSGFSFVFILVQHEAAEASLRQVLDAVAGSCDVSWRVLNPPLMELVYSLPELILKVTDTPIPAATWVVGSHFPGRHDQKEWIAAWRHTAARLNERRDLLRARLQAPLIISGPAWLMKLLLIEAPDLWSARALVVRHPADTVPHASDSSVADHGASAGSIQELIRRTSLIELMDRFRVFPQPLSPVTLERWCEQDVSLALDLLRQKRLRLSAASIDELLQHVLDTAWCVAAHRDQAELSYLLDELHTLLRPFQSDGHLLSDKARQEAWPQFLALDAWRGALRCDWRQAGQRAQEAIAAADLFAKKPREISLGALSGARLAREIAALCGAMLGTASPRSTLELGTESFAVTPELHLPEPTERRQLEQCLWLLAHKRYRDAESALRSFGQQARVSAFDPASEEAVFLAQTRIVCLLGQRRLKEAEREADQLAAHLCPERAGLRQFVHGINVLAVIYLLCRRSGGGKRLVFAALQSVEQAPDAEEGWIHRLRYLLFLMALADRDSELVEEILSGIEEQAGLVAKKKSTQWTLRALRYLPGMAACVSYLFWLSLYTDLLEQTQDAMDTPPGRWETWKLRALRAVTRGWSTTSSGRPAPRI